MPEPDVFVNPYTFVGFPTRVPEDWRDEPAGHDRLAADKVRYSGTIDVTITARSPLLLRNVHQDETGAEGGISTSCFPRKSRDGATVPFIPGSSLAGAVRSVHEILAGGCLRVFDDEFVPGYRDRAVARDESWKLLRIVTTDKDGRPKTVQPCAEAVWLAATDVAAALGGPEKVSTGAYVRVAGTGGPKTVEFGSGHRGQVTRLELGTAQRLEPPEDAEAPQPGDSVVLVSPPGARKEFLTVKPKVKGAQRSEYRKDKDGKRIRGGYFVASGRIDSGPVDATLLPGAWESYRAAASGADDVRRDPSEPDSDMADVPVYHKADVTPGRAPTGPPVGYRFRVRRRLYEGQVVWARYQETGNAVAIKEIAVSAIWRHAGSGPAGDRVPEYLWACRFEDGKLCPTCRVLGSADTGGREAARAEQRSYRGHVRFGDAVSAGATGTTTVYLPPFGEPRPGAGQAYLENRATKGLGDPVAFADQGEPPYREWGSGADTSSGHTSSRGLRGRKRYWLTKDSGRRPYFRATSGDMRAFHTQHTGNQELLSRAESVDPGSVFTSRVSVENLSEAELGSLLAALDPSLLFSDAGFPHGPSDGAPSDGAESGDAPSYGWQIGGGAPLGFGTVTTDVTVRVATPEARYLGTPDEPAPDARSAVSAFVQLVASYPKEKSNKARQAQHHVWRHAQAALRLDRAEPELVWYPPAKQLSAERTPTPNSLGPEFRFWKYSDGSSDETQKSPLIKFPMAGDPDVEIYRRTDAEGGRKQR